MAEETEKSVEDRLMSAIAPELDEPEETEERVVEPVVEGDDEPEVEETEESEETEETAEVEPEFVELELGGKTYEVPVELKDGFLKNEDYTQKTQTLAEERREVELQKQQITTQQAQYRFVQEIQDDLNEINQIDYQLKAWEDYLGANAKDMDAHAITLAQLEIRNGEKQRDEKTAALKGRQAEFQQAQEQAVQELLTKGTEILKGKIPGWGEEKQAEMRDYALSLGFTKDEVASIVDPRHVQVLYENAQYRKLQPGVKGAVKKVETAQAITPKSRQTQMPKEVGRKLNLQKKLKNPKLSSQDKAQAILESGVLHDKFG
jgi:hypothetical protein